MAEYIDRETILTILKNNGNKQCRDIVHSVSTVPCSRIVRCKECKYWFAECAKKSDTGKLYSICDVHHYADEQYWEGHGWCPTENDFCSYGEMREDG